MRSERIMEKMNRLQYFFMPKSVIKKKEECNMDKRK